MGGMGMGRDSTLFGMGGCGLERLEKENDFQGQSCLDERGNTFMPVGRMLETLHHPETSAIRQIEVCGQSFSISGSPVVEASKR